MSKPSVLSQVVAYLLSGNESTHSLSSRSAHLYCQWFISRSITPSIILWIHLLIQGVWQRLSTNILPTFSPFPYKNSIPSFSQLTATQLKTTFPSLPCNTHCPCGKWDRNVNESITFRSVLNKQCKVCIPLPVDQNASEPVS